MVLRFHFLKYVGSEPEEYKKIFDETQAKSTKWILHMHMYYVLHASKGPHQSWQDPHHAWHTDKKEKKNFLI